MGIVKRKNLEFVPDATQSTRKRICCSHILLGMSSCESNRKAMYRNLSNQKANPALKTKTGNK